jgi:hypothetical protein
VADVRTATLARNVHSQAGPAGQPAGMERKFLGDYLPESQPGTKKRE